MTRAVKGSPATPFTSNPSTLGEGGSRGEAMKAKIHVTLKKGILDPQGLAIEHALATLGFGGASHVRVGKYLEVDLNESAKDKAEAQVKAMCEKLLANTVIEEYSYEVVGDP